MKWVFNDGGRLASGFKGKCGDCVVRAVAIATEQDYGQVYAILSEGCKTERKSKRSSKKTSARDGVHVRRKWFRDYMDALGWTWVATMGIGTGCKVHLRDGELPDGRLIVNLSRHCAAVIDGVIHDTHNPSRAGTRCVYGYWIKNQLVKHGIIDLTGCGPLAPERSKEMRPLTTTS